MLEVADNKWVTDERLPSSMVEILRLLRIAQNTEQDGPRNQGLSGLCDYPEPRAKSELIFGFKLMLLESSPIKG